MVKAVCTLFFLSIKVWILFCLLVVFLQTTKEALPWIYHIYRDTMRSYSTTWNKKGILILISADFERKSNGSLKELMITHGNLIGYL